MEKKYWKNGKFTANEKYQLRMQSETQIVRLRNHPMLKTEQGRLLRRCLGKCVYCGLHFRDGDILEVDHHIPLYLGGKDTLDHQNILHRHCHDQRHAASKKHAQECEQAAQMNGAHDKS